MYKSSLLTFTFFLFQVCFFLSSTVLNYLFRYHWHQTGLEQVCSKPKLCPYSLNDFIEFTRCDSGKLVAIFARLLGTKTGQDWSIKTTELGLGDVQKYYRLFFVKIDFKEKAYLSVQYTEACDTWKIEPIRKNNWNTCFYRTLLIKASDE